MKDRAFINPFTDFGFKRIFGQTIHRDLLIDFLNALLKGERTVVELSFNNPELQPEVESGKRVIFDVYCESDDGTEFIVEMQALRQDHFLDRALYYQSRILVAQGRKGKTWNYELCPVYGIFFMDFTMDGSTEFRTDVALANMRTGKLFNDKLRQIFLEMPRFTKEADECENDFERWLYMIKNMSILKRMPFKAQKAVWDRLLEVADLASLSAEELMQYEESLKNYRDYHNTMNTVAREGRQIGYEEGKIEGRKHGRIEGRREGRIEGRKEGRKEGKRSQQIETAKSLKADNFPIELIQRYTGLSTEEIQQL